MTPAPAVPKSAGWRVLVQVAPRSLANTAIGCVGPSVLFLLGRSAWGLGAAVGLTAAWNCAWQGARRLTRKPFSGLLLLGLLELVLRTSASLAFHSARLFFVTPAVATALTGVVYIATSLLGRPLLSAVLADLVPSSLVDLSGPSLNPVIRKLSILYGSEQIVVAAVSIAMVLRLSMAQYVALHTLVSWSGFGLVVAVAAVAFRGDLARLVPNRRPLVVFAD